MDATFEELVELGIRDAPRVATPPKCAGQLLSASRLAHESQRRTVPAELEQMQKTALGGWLKKRFEPLATATPLPGVGARLKGTPLIVDVDPTGPGVGVAVPHKVTAKLLSWLGMRRLAERLRKAPGWGYVGVEMHGPLPIPFPGVAAGPEDARRLVEWLRKGKEEEKPAVIEKKAAQPYWQRALKTQVYQPSWNPKQPWPQNLLSNIHQTYLRGQRMVTADDLLRDWQGSMNPNLRFQRALQYLRGGEQLVTDPLDRFLFRGTIGG